MIKELKDEMLELLNQLEQGDLDFKTAKELINVFIDKAFNDFDTFDLGFDDDDIDDFFNFK